MHTLFLTLILAQAILAQAFDVATIKPTPEDWRGGRYFRMVGPGQWVATNYTPRVLIAAAYGVTPRAVEGGPSWLDSDHFDTVATTPSATQPPVDQQLAMLKTLLADRFALKFHMEQKELPAYVLSIAKGGPKLKESTQPPDGQPDIVNRVYPGWIGLPARNAAIPQFAAMLQRTVFDRTVVDKTGLAGRYDFDLEWTPDESQFGGQFSGSPESTKPGFFSALQEQLGLKLEATRALVSVLAIDHIERPSEN